MDSKGGKGRIIKNKFIKALQYILLYLQYKDREMNEKHTIKIIRNLGMAWRTRQLFAKYILLFDGNHQFEWGCYTNDRVPTEDEKVVAKRNLYEQLYANLDSISKGQYMIKPCKSDFLEGVDETIARGTIFYDEIEGLICESRRKEKILAIAKRKHTINKIFQED